MDPGLVSELKQYLNIKTLDHKINIHFNLEPISILDISLYNVKNNHCKALAIVRPKRDLGLKTHKFCSFTPQN